MSERTDTERLDWLGKSCDLGRILLDPDLEGTPRISWNTWNTDSDEGFSNPRDAIDAAMAEYERQEAAMKALDTDI